MNLGDRAKDRINGFVGIVIGAAQYLYGCRQILLAPEGLTEKGERQNAEWIDEDRCEVILAAVFGAPVTADERAGGPLTEPAPQRR